MLINNVDPEKKSRYNRIAKIEQSKTNQSRCTTICHLTSDYPKINHLNLVSFFFLLVGNVSSVKFELIYITHTLLEALWHWPHH